MRSALYIFLVSIVLPQLISCNQNKLRNTGSEDTIETTGANINIDIMSNSFNTLPKEIVDTLNLHIRNKGLNTFEGILAAYAPKIENAEGNYKYEYQFTNLGKDGAMITLEETGIPDDSIEGRKVIIQLIEDVGEVWKAVSIKETYRCWQGRGHETWSAEACK
jgi:hypothetical protein